MQKPGGCAITLEMVLIAALITSPLSFVQFRKLQTIAGTQVRVVGKSSARK
jgi:hypothetical protein